MIATAMYDVLARIDTLWEQPLPHPFDQLVKTELPWRQHAHTPVERAAVRLIDGLWLSYLGYWCPDDLARVTWNGTPFAETKDAPLGLHFLLTGVAARTVGCRIASMSAAPEQLMHLRARIPIQPSSLFEAFQALALEWMALLYQQRQDERDWFGNPLPASIEILSALFHASAPATKQGNTSIVTPIARGRQGYFVKQLIEPGPMLTLYEGFQRECATIALLNVLPQKLGPHTGCLYVGTDGTLSFLSSKVAGVSMRDIRRAASRVSLASVQTAVLGEFVGNLKDRHENNIFIDRFHAQPWLIDFAPALDSEMSPIILPDATSPLDLQRETFTAALWTWHPDCLRTANGETLILEDVLWSMCGAREAAVDMLQPFGLPAALTAAVENRFALLEQLAHSSEEKTIEALNRLIIA